MTTGKYEGVVAAAMKGENALWEIGDEIIKALGKRAGARLIGDNDGSYKILEEIANELVANGIDKYETKSLADIRITASNFQGSDRIRKVSFTSHRVAGTPAMLTAAMDYANQLDKKVSPDLIREYKKIVGDEEKKARKEARQDAINAKKEAEAEAAKAREEKRQANSKEAKEAAAKREHEAKERAKEAAALANDLKSPPPINHSVPKKGPADVPMLVVRATFNADVEKAKALAKKMDRDIDPHLENLSDAFVANAVEELLEAANAFRQLSNKIRSGKANKRSHLYAVGE
jgi:hypothetical protein